MDNGTTVFPRNWLPFDGCCCWSNWSMPECIFRTTMVKPFLENALLSSKSLLGINYRLWFNTRSDTNYIPLRAFLFFIFLNSETVLHPPISHILSISMIDGCIVTQKSTLSNVIQYRNIPFILSGEISFTKLSLSQTFKAWSWCKLMLILPWSLSLWSF